jgi:hypothetical protein
MHFAQNRVIVCIQALAEAATYIQFFNEVITPLNHKETADKQDGKWGLWPCELLHMS